MLELTQNAPQWDNAGTKPPVDLISNGWKANQKPPADYFNWFFHTAYESIKELQEKAALKNNATTTTDGLMSKNDKTKLDDIESNAQKNPGVATIIMAGLMSSADRLKLDNIEPYAQKNRGIASQAQAEGGIDTTTVMTPQRTKQAIDKLIALPNANAGDSLNATYWEGFSNGLTFWGVTGSLTNKPEVTGFLMIYKKAGYSIINVIFIGSSGNLFTLQATGSTATWKRTTYDKATTTIDGIMSKEDKLKLDNIETGAQKNRTIATQAQAEAGTDDTVAMTPLKSKQLLSKNSMVVVNHGTNAFTARPTGATVVYWVGSVSPINALDNDLWMGGV